MKPFILACFAALLLSSCKKESADSLNTYVSSNSVTHDDVVTTYLVDVETYSECTREFVHVTGYVELRYHAIMKEDGAYHIISKARNLNIHGVGVTTGKTYKQIGHYSSEWHYELKGGIYKVTSRGVLATPGGGNNLVYTSTTNYVTNADGEFVVQKVNETVQCQ
jgi:hypothetical protein